MKRKIYKGDDGESALLLLHVTLYKHKNEGGTVLERISIVLLVQL